MNILLKYYKRKLIGILTGFLIVLCSGYAEADNPKREFRGAWLHLIGQTQWMNKNSDQQQEYIENQFDKLQQAGCNAVIFQVRPCADAAYKSDIEEWSQWLTGKRGRCPDKDWDPLAFAIDEAHKRGMELHAWINPYRVTSSPKEILPSNHIVNREPARFFRYDGKILFDPAYRENRDYICNIVKDILVRYDIDGLHIDDYFYPYPAPGQKIPDDNSYNKFGNGKNRGDWRRENVNMLIEQLYHTIKETKPWVRFGISPFGIWRNKKSDPRGSDSNGLENYDSLYADILLWTEKGWVDYLSPQLYWELDKKVAPSRNLAKWWSDNSNGVDIYIGQDLRLTMNTPDTRAGKKDELDTKIELSRTLPDVKGNIWFHGYWLTDNYKGASDRLAMNQYSTLALPPVYGDEKDTPYSVESIRIEKKGEEEFLEWDAIKNGHTQKAGDVVRYVVYEFYPGESQNISDSSAIVAITPYTSVKLPKSSEETIYAVTSLDRMNRESAPIFIYRNRD